jgi:tricorn protease
VGPSGGEVAYVDISDRLRIVLQEQASQKFLEASRILGEQFYHPTMKDLDWTALAQKYHGLARQSRTADEFNYIANRMIGELNASHLGISASSPPSPNRQPFGRLGTVHRRVADGFEVVRVIPQTPAAKGPRALKAGDVITAIDLQPLEAGETIESRLQGRIGEEVIVSFRRVQVVPTAATAPALGAGAAPRTLDLQTIITPISFGEERQLKYLDWRQRTVEMVAELSDGKIGYIHIAGMDEPSLDVFERDLYAAANDKNGLIIDVRNNGGGWTADRLLSSIMVQQHAYTIPRGADPKDIGHYPQDRLFIQRYTLPINMLCNEKSFSNAEIISHAFKTLKRGTLVGQQTYGGVISTGGTRLIDGTFVRLPFRGWYLPDGTDMENHGATPDIIVPQTPEAESRDEDEQVKAAVEDLLKRIK